MVEQTAASMNHGHTIGVSSDSHTFILNRATGLGDVLDTILGSLINVITEGEEGIGDKRDVVHGLDESVLLLLGERFRDDLKESLPLLIFDFSEVTFNVTHASIHTVLLLHTLLELQAQDLGMLTEIPQSSLASLQ